MHRLNSILAGLTLLSSVAAQCNFDPTCWQYSVGCSISNAFPFERKAPMTCQQCMDLCNQRKTGTAPYICQSAVFDNSCATCDIYAVKAQGSQGLMQSAQKTYFQPFGSGNCGGNQTTGAPAGDDCPSGQFPVVVAFKNSMTSTVSGGKTFPAASSDECLQQCIQNKDKSGSAAPCKTAQFNGGQCTLSPTAPVANSQGTLQATDGSYYYEKQCLTTNCKSILMDPKHIIVGFNKKTVDASSYSQCLQFCLDAQKSDGFQCNSGQYFADSTNGNCVLNTETATTQPDKYLATQDQVTYFEPRCNNARAKFLSAFFNDPAITQNNKKTAFNLNSIPVEGGDWTLWTDCSAGKTQRVRYRNCRETRIHRCPNETMPCNHEDMVAEENRLKSSNKNADIIRKDLPVPVAMSISPIKPTGPPAGLCQALIDDKGVKRCDIGIRIIDGHKKFCTPVEDC